MGRCDIKKLTRADDLGVLPEFRKVALVVRQQVVCASGVGTFDEHVVFRIGRDLIQTRRCDNVTVVLDQLNQLLSQAPADLEFGPRQDRGVLQHNLFRDIPSRGLG